MVADDAKVERHVHDRYRDSCREDPLPDLVREQERDDDREQEEREHEERVHDQHEDAVELAAEVPGKEPERDADRDREKSEMNDLELGLRAPDDPREDVGRLDVRAHEMVGGRGLELRETLTVRPERVEVVRREDGSEKRDQDECDRDPAPIQSIARAIPRASAIGPNALHAHESLAHAGRSTCAGTVISTGSSGRCTR